MKKQPIDWVAVEAAMRRCKLGEPRHGDPEMCQRAYRRAPAEYGRRKDAVDEAVVREEKERWTLKR